MTKTISIFNNKGGVGKTTYITLGKPTPRDLAASGLRVGPHQKALQEKK